MIHWGLERWLSSYECLLPFKRTGVQLWAPSPSTTTACNSSLKRSDTFF